MTMWPLDDDSMYLDEEEELVIPDGSHVDDGRGLAVPACGEVLAEGDGVFPSLRVAKQALDPQVVEVVALLNIKLGKPCAECVRVLEGKAKT